VANFSAVCISSHFLSRFLTLLSFVGYSAHAMTRHFGRSNHYYNIFNLTNSLLYRVQYAV